MDKTLGEIHHLHKWKINKAIHGYISTIQTEIKKSKGVVPNADIYQSALLAIPTMIT